MSKYNINSFIYHRLPSDDIVVQNQKGIVKITNKNLISLLTFIDQNQIRKVKYEEINDFLSEDTDRAISFLKKHNILEVSIDGMNYNVERLQFISNAADFEGSFMYYMKQLKKDIEIDSICNNDLKEEFRDNDLIVVFLNPYDKKLVKEIYNRMQVNKECLLLMTYIYNSNFYMDNLYSPKWKNPCHYCHMGFIESQLRINQEGDLSYQGLIDILYHEDRKFAVETPISTIDIINFMSIIFNHLDNLIFRSKGHTLLYGESMEDINNIAIYDLLTKQTNVDTSIHWELCNCYE